MKTSIQRYSEIGKIDISAQHSENTKAFGSDKTLANVNSISIISKNDDAWGFYLISQNVSFLLCKTRARLKNMMK